MPEEKKKKQINDKWAKRASNMTVTDVFAAILAPLVCPGNEGDARWAQRVYELAEALTVESEKHR